MVTEECSEFCWVNKKSYASHVQNARRPLRKETDERQWLKMEVYRFVSNPTSMQDPSTLTSTTSERKWMVAACRAQIARFDKALIKVQRCMVILTRERRNELLWPLPTLNVGNGNGRLIRLGQIQQVGFRNLLEEQGWDLIQSETPNLEK